MIATLWQALVSGPLRATPAGAITAVVAIAIGVALGVAVHLINASASAEFARASRQLAGTADLVIRGGRSGFDEAIYPRIARLPGVAAASPALEFDASRRNSKDTLTIIGLDVLRAQSLQLAITPVHNGPRADLFESDAIRLSASAAQAFRVNIGDTLEFQVGTGAVTLRISDVLPDGAYRQQLGIMDIAAAQWRFGRLGRLNRIDVQLHADVDLENFQVQLQDLLPPGVHAATPNNENARSAALTRSYRLNLDMLGTIALFTGAFLVYTSQVLALLRRRAQIALLRALGVTRRAVLSTLLLESLLIGALGSALGVVTGLVLARQVLSIAGADLGAGYFRLLRADLVAEPLTLIAFCALGILAAVVGAAVPVWEAANRPPAQALRAGDAEDGRPGNVGMTWGITALAAGLALAAAPPLFGMPIAGYAAIALLLIGAVMVLPRTAGALLARIPRPAALPLNLGFAQLQAAPRHTAISMAGILVSLSLVAAMLIMVTSFRLSLDHWLDRVLPADLYIRAASNGVTAFLNAEQQNRISRTRGIAHAEFLRTDTVLLYPDKAPITLIARDFSVAPASQALPLVAPPLPPDPRNPPTAWISEVAAELYGWHVGQQIMLPLGGKMRRLTVAGIWRDYARRGGAVTIDRRYYVEATGDHAANDAAIRLLPGVAQHDIEQALHTALGPETAMEIDTATSIRRASLDIFDRTFAITWALEFAALIVGLFGVSVAFSAQAIARKREFGVLRHLGMTRREIGLMLAGGGVLTAGMGAIGGLITGTVIGLILVQVVNRQSFHWSMDLHLPWLALLALAGAIQLCAAGTAVLSGRLAMRPDAVRAVRDDW